MTFKLSETNEFIKGFLLSNLTIDDYKVIFKYKHWDVSTDIRPYELNELGQEIVENHIISLLTNTDTFKSAFRDFKLNSIIN